MNRIGEISADGATYNLWSSPQGQVMATNADGYIMGATIHDVNAVDDFIARGYPIDPSTGYPPHGSVPPDVFNEVWGKANRDAMNSAVLSDHAVVSWGLDMHANPGNTAQVRDEFPAFGRAQGVNTGLNFFGAGMGFYNLSQSDPSDPRTALIGIGAVTDTTAGIITGSSWYLSRSLGPATTSGTPLIAPELAGTVRVLGKASAAATTLIAAGDTGESIGRGQYGDAAINATGMIGGFAAVVGFPLVATGGLAFYGTYKGVEWIDRTFIWGGSSSEPVEDD
jgi:hypothetical protein